MNQSSPARLLRQQGVVVLTAGLVFFFNLGSANLFDEDEPKNAVCGREMLERGDWIVPTFNGNLRPDKPILVYWLMLCSYTVFGVNEFAARFGSAVMAVGTSWGTYHLGRKLFHSEAGMWGGIVQSTCLLPSVIGRMATPDSTFVFCTTASILGYVWAVASRREQPFGGSRTGPSSRPWDHFVPASALRTLPMYGFMGLAVLAKGPAGLVLPCTVIGVFLLILQQDDRRRARDESALTSRWRRGARELTETFHPRRLWRAARAMHLLFGTLVVGAVALPWYVAVGIRSDGAWLTGFLGTHNVGRFLQPMEGHWGPVIYYLPVILAGCAPWSSFLPRAVWLAAAGYRGDRESHRGELFLLVWAGVWIAFFSAARTKLPSYVVPAFPALALLIGACLARWCREIANGTIGEFRAHCLVQGAASIAALVGLSIAIHFVLPDAEWLGVVAAWSLAGGAFAYVSAGRGKGKWALPSMGITAVALTATVVGVCTERIGRHQEGVSLGRLIRELSASAPRPLATCDYFAPNLVYYSGQRVVRLDRTQCADFLVAHPDGLILTRADRLDEVENSLPGGSKIVARHRCFLRSHDIALLGGPLRTADEASRSAAR